MLPTTAACTQRKAWSAARFEGRLINDRYDEWAWASARAGIRFQGEARRRGARACRERDRGTPSASFGAEPAGTVDIKVTNENNAALGVDAIVTDVDFSIEENATLFEVDGARIKPA
jgi:hypothetical protein